MKRIYLLITLFLSVTSWVANAQTKLSDKPEEFIKDVNAMMALSKNAEAIKAGHDLEVNWGGRIDDRQKMAIITTSRKMTAKKYRALPIFKTYFEAINAALTVQNISSPEFDKLLAVTDKAVDRYESRTLISYLETSRNFLAKRLLYSSNFNQLAVHGGTFSFEFKDEQEDIPVETPVAEEKPADETKPTDKKAADDGWFTELDAPPAETPIDVLEVGYVKPEQPALAGAIIKFEGISLTIITAHDSATLTNTKGSLRLQDGIFVGSGGKFTWESVGMPDVFVEFKEYNFNTKLPKLNAEGVMLTYVAKVDAQIEGIFEFNSKKRGKGEVAQYPRFMSFNNNVVVKDLGPNLSYKGGFSLAGKKIYSSSVNERYATISFNTSGKPKFKTYGRRYELGDSAITAERVSVSLYQSLDSIYHPSINLLYDKTKAELKISKSDGGFKNTPYVDTYHKVDITTDAIKWKLSEESINFYTLSGKKEVPTLFESHDFFNADRYRSVSGLYAFHPLQMLMAYSKAQKKDSFYADDLAKAYKQNVNTIKGAMYAMMQKGYVDYDPSSGLIKINRKGAHNVYSFSNKKDYDNLLIPSLMNLPTDTASNATLDLTSNILTIRGVPKFNLSDSLRVYITPRNREIKLMRDRYFLLEGEIAVGNFKFRGKDFYFNYEEFTVAMPTIDSITFISADSQMKNDKTEIGGEIRYEAGTLYINRPDNKSGRKNFPEYPRLSVTAGGSIYFDFNQNDRLNGTYNRNVLFKIPAIDLDSLNSKDPDFIGTFYSDGIFPEFDEKLITMPDNSLGFKHKSPKGVYPLYKSKSVMRFTGELVMNKQGLRAPGQIEHLSTILKSNDFLFTPDSVITRGTSGEIKEVTVGGAYFPPVNIKEYALKWMPKVDSMAINNIKTPFVLHGGSSEIEGALIIRTSGLYGNGLLRRKDSEVNSISMAFQKDKFTAKSAAFKVNSNVKTKPALLGTDVDVDFDLGKSLVKIAATKTSISDSSSLQFPYANYRTTIDRAEWDISKKVVMMSGDVNSSTFISMAPDQDSLSFNGSQAAYSIDKMTLNIGGIPYIKSADAKVIPDKGQVSILENAVMKPLTNARLQVDTLNSYHNLINGNVQVVSRRKFVGDATYQYVNVLSDTFNIKMGDFELRESENQKRKNKDRPAYYTVAQGKIEEIDNFFVSSRILYKGGMTMLAPEQNLHLDGFIKPQLKSRPDLGSWVTYKSNKTENVVITVDEKLTSEGVRLYTGMHFERGTSELYTTFLSPKRHPDDKDVFISQGTLNYNASINQFKVSPADKEAGTSYEGSVLIFDDAKGTINMEGKLDIFSFGSTDYVSSSGFSNVDFAKKTTDINALLAFNFPLPPNSLTTMGDKLVSTKLDGGLDMKEANADKEALYLKLAALIGNGATKAYKNKADADYTPLAQASRKMLTTLVISNVTLHWSEENRSFYSSGKIGVSNVGASDVNLEMNGFVEIRKNADGDELTVYLEETPDVWYFMNFQQGQLGLLSSDEEFNNIILSKAKGKAKPGQYSFLPAGPDERLAAIERFVSTYKPEKSFAAKNAPEKKPEVVEEDKGALESKPLEDGNVTEEKKTSTDTATGETPESDAKSVADQKKADKKKIADEKKKAFEEEKARRAEEKKKLADEKKKAFEEEKARRAEEKKKEDEEAQKDGF